MKTLVNLIGMSYRFVKKTGEQQLCSASINKILFIALGGIGDVIMKTPAITNLRKAFPEAHIAVLTNTGPSSEVLANCPYVDDMIFIGKEKLKYRQNPVKLMKLILSFRREGFDMVITSWVGLSIWAALFSYFTGAPIRVGFNKHGQGFLHTVQVPVENKKQTVEYNLDLIRALGTKIHDKSPKMWPKEADYKKVGDFLMKNEVDDDHLVVGIYPGSARIGLGWRWFPERYAEVADRLTEEYRARMIVFGGSLEVEVAEVIQSHSKVDLINAVGKFSVNQTAALAERCNLFICNDGGVMHIAEAMDVPIVSVWGPTDPERSRPYSGPERNITLKKDIECAPCYNYRPIECEHRKCLQMVTVNDVIDAVKQLLQTIYNGRIHKKLFSL